MTPRPEFPLAAWLFFELLHVLAYTVKSVWLRRALFFAILSICAYASIYTSMDFSRIGMGKRGITSRLPMVVLFVSANAILKDPLKDIRRIGQKDDVSNAPFLTRLWRGMHLWANTRGVNYAHEPTSSLPPRPTQQTRWAFVVAELKAIALDFVVFDLVSIMNRANPYFTPDVPVVVGSQRLWWFAGFGFGATIGPLMSIQHRVMTIILVTLGISKPYDCPAYFGSPLEAYTVRRLWGKTWHQTLRIGCVTHAEYLARRLRLPPKSKMTTAIKLMIVFVVSGVLHWIGEAVPIHSLTHSVGTLIFFLLQVVAILTEQIVISFGQEMGIKPGAKWIKAIGYLWVFLWINTTLPIWTAEGFRGGWIEELPQFSVILGILRGEWFPVNKPLGRPSS